MDSQKSSEGERDAQGSDVLDQLSSLKEEVKSTQARLEAFERRMSFLNQSGQTFSAHGQGVAPTEITDEYGDDNVEDYNVLTAKNTIPKVRECAFAEFKNRFDPEGRDGCFAVDVLVSGPLLDQEVDEEHRLRDKLFEQRGPAVAPRVAKEKAATKAVKMASQAVELLAGAQVERKWPRRIRIQSPALLRLLAKVNRQKWTDRPRTYYRPFSPLIFHHPHMRKALQELEDRWGDYVNADGTVSKEAETVYGDSDGDEASVVDSPAALLCLREYVQYMERKILPAYREFENKDASSNSTVRFSDLWHLFRTGELVFRQVDRGLADNKDLRSGKRIWKTYFTVPVFEATEAATRDRGFKDAMSQKGPSTFTLGCYYVEYNGEGFCIVKTKFEINTFPGKIPVSSLPVFPLRFCPDWQRRLENCTRRGDALIKAIEEKHCFYNGWSLTKTPSGLPTTDEDGALLHHPEHINSEVMVDFNEAFQTCPAWQPKKTLVRTKVVEDQTIQEDFKIRWWSGRDRRQLLGETPEIIPIKSGITAWQRNQHASEDPFLVTVAENVKRGVPTTANDLTPDAKALLTDRVFAYVFQERKFAQLAVSKLRPSAKTGLALDSLKIPSSVKDAIQGSVHGHFIQKNAESKIDQDWMSLDLIQGKGTGLFILLHGAPGVGKTATAEAIAKANGKALFKITVGDLGMTPENVETSLRDIFRLASIWDCILLLDEVDTFFSQRSKADTAGTKNALVSGGFQCPTLGVASLK